MPFDPIESVISVIKAGEIVVIADDEDRENEGDFICAASHATPQAVNFMLRYGRGLFCVPLAPELATPLGLCRPAGRQDPRGTCFTQSVDAVGVTTTGVSAHDRAATVAALLRPGATFDDFWSPGHVFPLIARPGGVLERPGHTEAAVDLARLAGLPPAGVLCEILREDGAMARVPELVDICRRHNLKFGCVKQLITYRER